MKKLLILITSLALFSCDENENEPLVENTFLFTTNNSNGNLGFIDLNAGTITAKTFPTGSTAADGAFYDPISKSTVQVSRSGKMIESFLGINDLSSGMTLNSNAKGGNEMISPRELAVSGNFYVVADNQDVDGNAATNDGRLFIYSKTATGFQLRNTIVTDIKLWGITFDGNSLYAVADADNKLALYANFLSNTGNMSLAPTKIIAIEGIVRTHGITYDSGSDIMVLTDIGSAANTQDDGGFQIISDFKAIFNGTVNNGMIPLNKMVRVAGSSTLMGNPVDVAYDNTKKIVYVAEAGNGGGRILSYSNIGNGGNLSPVLNLELAAASSVFLHKGN